MDDLYNNDDLFDVLEAHLPENLPESSVAALCGFLISTFSGTLPEAMAVVRNLTAQLADFYEYKQGEECDCTNCTAKRAEQLKH
jgi:hypothetical protein